MPRYRIEVYGENHEDAKNTIIDALQKNPGCLEEVTYNDPKTSRTWHKDTDVYAQEIYDNLEEEIMDFIKGGETDVDEITNHLDLRSHTIEYADGMFIYSDRASMNEALDFMDEFPEHVEDDAYLWEGKSEPTDIINIQATYTMDHVLYEKVEKLIQDAIDNYEEPEEDPDEEDTLNTSVLESIIED